ncbi:hypothetical protein [Weissella tructae]
MPNNRHRRVARLRTPEERERLFIAKLNDTFDADVSNVEEAKDLVSKVIDGIVDGIKRVLHKGGDSNV